MTKTRRNWNLCIDGGNIKWFNPPWKTIWQFLKKLKAELPGDLVIALLSIWMEDLTAGSQTGPQQHHSEQLKGRSNPTAHGWVSEWTECGVWNVIQPWKGRTFCHSLHTVNHESIMQGETSQVWNDKDCVIPLTWGPDLESQSHKDRRQRWWRGRGFYRKVFSMAQNFSGAR